MLKKKTIILSFVSHYLPGYKAGGPIRTLANMVDRLGDEFQFNIITADRDFNDTKAYAGPEIGRWNRVSKADVLYTSQKMRSLKVFRKILSSTQSDIIYLNSFFSHHFTIRPLLLRRLNLISSIPFILAPRGEFSPGALGLKSLKKTMYIWTAKAFGLYHGIIWHASSEYEEVDIRRWFGRDVQVVVAPNLLPLIHLEDELQTKRKKASGSLKIIFLSRISRKKNLHIALKMLNGLKGKVSFNIYGPMEDKNYWAECKKIIAALPENIKVRYCSSVEHANVSTVMSEHDIFFLPTLGENFGHVILEAICAGCPVLISDQTPWRDLARKGIGWDLPLNNSAMFRQVLQTCIDMNQGEYDILSKRARKYGFMIAKDDGVVEQNRHLFQLALSTASNNSQERIIV